MSTQPLKQFQEEEKKGFRSIWGNITKDTQHLTTEKIEDFLSQQTTLAYELGKKEAEQEFRKTLNSGRKMYELGKKEMLEMVIDELESNPNKDGSVSPSIQHWIERKQMQFRKLLALNEE